MVIKKKDEKKTKFWDNMLKPVPCFFSSSGDIIYLETPNLAFGTKVLRSSKPILQN